MKQRDIRKDMSGGIEGLPLQLMIVILIATMGTAILVGWMGNLDTPQSIGDIEAPDKVTADESSVVSEFSIEVRDQDGELLEGAVVMIDENFVTMGDSKEKPIAETDANGVATFKNLSVNAPNGASYVFIDVLVHKSGYGEKNLEIMVVL